MPSSTFLSSATYAPSATLTLRWWHGKYKQSFKQSGKNVNRSYFHICVLFSICTHELIALLFLVAAYVSFILKHTLHMCTRFHSSCHPEGTVPGMPQHFAAWSSHLNYSLEYTNPLPFLPTLENTTLIWSLLLHQFSSSCCCKIHPCILSKTKKGVPLSIPHKIHFVKGSTYFLLLKIPTVNSWFTCSLIFPTLCGW